MKKTPFIALLILLALPVMSQGKKYTKAMQAALEKSDEAGDPDSKLQVAADFEKIAGDYPDQWLPDYHAALMLVTGSLEETETTQREALLDRSKSFLLKMEALAPGESEVQVLKALYFIGIISVDPDTRGPIYYQDAMFAIQKGLDLNPENPRAHYMNGMWVLNTPDFMGGGPEAARPILLEAQQKFQNYRNEDPFWPSWGEDLVQAELDRMKE